MAWNEPGGNNQDPWGKKRPNNQNDLDKMIKDAADKFGKLFGGGKKGDSNGSGSNRGFLVIGIIVFAAFYIVKGFYTVKEAEKGVVTRFGAEHRTVEPGLGWMPPFIDRLYKVDVNTAVTKNFKGTMLTKDSNIVQVELSVQYRVNIPEDYLFNVRDPQNTLALVTDAALRQVIGNSNIDDVLKDKKIAIMEDVRQEMEKIIMPYKTGLKLIAVNLQNSEAPGEVRSAFDDVTRSINDKNRSEEQAKAYREQIIPKAEGQAATMLQDAEAYRQRVVAESKGEVARFAKLLPQYEAAPEVTRQRLYIETIEQVMGSVSKVVIDSKGGNNLTYLPLDQIVNKKTQKNSSKQEGK